MTQPSIMNYLFKKATKEKIPLSASFEISPECNMDCKMCYVKMTSSEMKKIGRKRTVEEWIDIAEQGKKLGLLHILLTGGEPFLQKDFKELYLRLKKMGFIVSINSNGTMINEEIVSWLSKSPPNVINITLYGSSNDTYSRLCNNPKGLDQVKNAVKLLKNNNIQIKLNASMTPYNIDDLEGMFEIADELGVKLNPTTYMFPPTRRDKELMVDNFRLNECEAGKYAAYIDFKKSGNEIFKQKAKCVVDALIDNGNIVNKSLPNNKGLDISCRAGKSTAWITWDGKMMACGIMNNFISYPFEIGFESAWKEIVEYGNSIKLNPKCVSCSKRQLCNICPAVSYDETGSINEIPQYMCDMTDQRIRETENIYNKLIQEDNNKIQEDNKQIDTVSR